MSLLTIIIDQPTRLTSAVNSADGHAQQVQQPPQVQRASAGIVGTGQSTIAATSVAEKSHPLLNGSIAAVSGSPEKGKSSAQNPTDLALCYTLLGGQKVKLHSEQERGVAAFTRAMINNGFCHVEGEQEIQQEVDRALQCCKAFLGAEIRIKPEYVQAACLNACLFCPEISTEDIKLYAASFGYKLMVTETLGKPGIIKTIDVIIRRCKILRTITRAELEQLLKRNPDDAKKA